MDNIDEKIVKCTNYSINKKNEEILHSLVCGKKKLKKTTKGS